MRSVISMGAAFLLFGFAGCKAQEKPGHRPTKDPVVYEGVLDSSCAVEMQFGSYGSGIDSEAYRKAMELIGEYNLSYTTKNIGREGETRICLPLTGLEKRKRKEFIERLKEVARAGQLVSVSIR